VSGLVPLKGRPGGVCASILPAICLCSFLRSLPPSAWAFSSASLAGLAFTPEASRTAPTARWPFFARCSQIQTDYVTDPNINDVTTGALHGLLESLDADSSYLTASEYKVYKQRPATGAAQVGITVSKRFGYAM